MRKSARIAALARLFLSVVFALGLSVVFLFGLSEQTNAQTTSVTPAQQQSNTFNDFRTPNVAPDVERNHHTYTQIVVIDVLSAIVCQMVGIDPTNPRQPCLGVNPHTGQFGYATPPTQFGQSESSGPQIGGAVGFMSNQIGYLYTPAISSSQYTNYLASNFGIVKSAHAQTAPDQQFRNCNELDPASGIGYGFCGLQIVFSLWTVVRDVAYAVLTVAFIFLALGVMLRFKVDPRTVMTLQNQIPRVIIAILLITFSYAIAGLMIDLMWTVTYTGINIISRDFSGELCGETGGPAGNAASLTEVATFNLIDQPLNYVDKIFSQSCDSNLTGGIVNVAGQVSYALGDLIESSLFNLFGLTNEVDCGFWNPIACLQEGFTNIFSYLVTIIAFIIIIAILFIALFRIWWTLLRTYVSLLIFVILGPLWIVMGLIPGRPLGFEKWMRVMFANLAAFPIVAFILVFGRLLMDAVPATPSPDSIFIPPLIGNPNANATDANTFGVILGFGAILLAPTVPDVIKQKMNASGNTKYGAALAGAVGYGAGVATAPATKAIKHMSRRNPQTGAPEGSLAVAKARMWQKTPLGKRDIDRKHAAHESRGDMRLFDEKLKKRREERKKAA